MSLVEKITETFAGKSYDGTPNQDMQRVLDAYMALGPKPLETLTPAEARLQPTPADAVKAVLREDGDDHDPKMGVVTRDFEISGPAGPIKARLYRTEGSSDKVRPVLGYWHGGGWVIADLDVYDSTPRALCKAADCLVISFHYRQAPEHKFPAAHEDAFAAYRWMLDNVAEHGGDPDRIAILGESAGGNLAANISIRARDTGVRGPVHQVLVYPVAGADMTRESYVKHANAKPLSKAGMEWFVSHVFTNASESSDRRIDLVNATLSGLPPTTIISAEIDPLCSEGQLLGERLNEAGVAVDVKLYRGVTHEFFGMGLVVDEAKAAEHHVAHALKRAFGTSIMPL